MKRWTQLGSLLALLLLPTLARAQAYSGVATSISGRPLPFAQVTVCAGWSDVLVQNYQQNCNTQAPLAPPSAPALAGVTGASPVAGTYQVVITYVNGTGETVGSPSTSVTTSGGNLNIQVTSPAAFSNATGWNAYFTVAGGSTFFLQNGSPVAIGSNYTQTTAISTSGANPPLSTSATNAILPLATIYSNQGQTTTLGNPTNADANGRYTFFMPGGNYTASVSSAGYTTYSYPLVIAGGAASVTIVTSNPVSCTTGQTFFNTTNQTLLICTATNTFSSPGGAGTATSVGLALPSQYNVFNSPVTTAGVLTGTWTSQVPGTVLGVPLPGQTLFDHACSNTGNSSAISVTCSPSSNNSQVAALFWAETAGAAGTPSGGFTQADSEHVWFKVVSSTSPITPSMTITGGPASWATALVLLGSNGTTPVWTSEGSGSVGANVSFNSGSFTPVAGSALVVSMAFNSGSSLPDQSWTITDSAFNVYTQVANAYRSDGAASALELVYVAQNVPAVSTTVTFTLNSSPGTAQLNYNINDVTNLAAPNSGIPNFVPPSLLGFPAVKPAISTTTTCPTSSTAGSTCTFTMTWATAFQDTAYAVACSGAGTITGFPSIQGVAKTTGGATVTVENGTANEAVASGYSEMDCIASHP